MPESSGAWALPDVVRRKADLLGASTWAEELPDLVDHLASAWSFTVTGVYDEGTEALVLAVVRHDGTPAVLKAVLPRDDLSAEHEALVLRLAAGGSCAELLRWDPDHGVLLLERLGPSMASLGLPPDERLRILADTVRQVWRPAVGHGLVTGAEKAAWLIEAVTTRWEELDRPCHERAIDHAVRCARRRVAAHDDEHAVLCHGDVHQWNALQAGGGFKLVDPDGLLAEREYDLGVLVREDPEEIRRDDPHERSRWLAARCDADEAAIWEWGAVERVSTGLLLTAIGLEPVGRELLAAADWIAVLD